MPDMCTIEYGLEVHVYVKPHVSVVYSLLGKAKEWLDHTCMGFIAYRLLAHTLICVNT